LLCFHMLPILRVSLTLKKNKYKVNFRLELLPAFKKKYVATERCA